MSIEQKLIALGKMADEAEEAGRVAEFKSKMYFEALEDLCVKELGFNKSPDGKVSFPLHKLVHSGFKKGKAE